MQTIPFAGQHSSFSVAESMMDLFDHDHDGAITRQEFLGVFEKVGIPVVAEQLDDLMREFDVDHSGGIDPRELVPLLCKMLAKTLHTVSELRQVALIKEDHMEHLKKLLAKRTVFNPDKRIEHVVILVVVVDEILPILERLAPQKSPEVSARLMHLGEAWVCTASGADTADSYTLTIVKVAESLQYKRHYSGYTQVSSLVPLIKKELNPDLLLSFGTSGGWPTLCKVGDAILSSGCVFIDRIRTNNKTAHDWGVFAGPVMDTQRLAQDLDMVQGITGSQISYAVTEQQVQLLDDLGVIAVDMECASEAQIAMQIELNFLAIKIISNGIYPGNPSRMEDEYVHNRALVSKRSMETLNALFIYLAGKTLGQL